MESFMNKKKIAILISGHGSNLQAFIDASKSGHFTPQIAIVASKNNHAFGLERAQKNSIPAFSSPNITQLFTEIDRFNVDLIILAGFMKIIPSNIVQKYHRKIINIHPSLLPELPGLNSIERAHNEKRIETGVTIHYVDEGVDTGKIISQETVPIYPSDSLQQLEERIHQQEHEMYPCVIQKIIQNGF